jgi:hypothetical protein
MTMTTTFLMLAVLTMPDNLIGRTGFPAYGCQTTEQLLAIDRFVISNLLEGTLVDLKEETTYALSVGCSELTQLHTIITVDESASQSIGEMPQSSGSIHTYYVQWDNALWSKFYYFEESK